MYSTVKTNLMRRSGFLKKPVLLGLCVLVSASFFTPDRSSNPDSGQSPCVPNSEFFYGGGLELPIARDNFLTLSITRHLGLTDINLSTEADFYHQGLSIMLGLNMPFGKK